MNHYATYLRQSSVCSTVIVRTPTNTHTHKRLHLADSVTKAVGEMLATLFVDTVSQQGAMERRLLNDLFITGTYNKLERPVLNESEALTVKFGLTIQQIIDVVSTHHPMFRSSP